GAPGHARGRRGRADGGAEGPPAVRRGRGWDIGGRHHGARRAAAPAARGVGRHGSRSSPLAPCGRGAGGEGRLSPSPPAPLPQGARRAKAYRNSPMTVSYVSSAPMKRAQTIQMTNAMRSPTYGRSRSGMTAWGAGRGSASAGAGAAWGL